ncbi:MAG: methylase, partial [Oligoflexales bacterium]|nr:methylase [Oligoflexales bacterium]
RHVIKEIEDQNLKLVFFVDDNIIGNREAAKDLFRALIPLKIKWVSQASLDQTQDLELMDLMAESGCIGNVVGFESINIESLREMKKAPNIDRFNLYKDEIKILDDHGLQTWAAFTFGHDHDTLATIRETVDFAKYHKFTFAAYNILMPYPGTPLYDSLRKEKRLLYNEKWWLHPEYRFNYAAYKPKNMTHDELTEACLWARRSFNSLPSIASRLFARKTNMRSISAIMRYLAYTPLFRRETFKKQGMLFGFTSRLVEHYRRGQRASG